MSTIPELEHDGTAQVPAIAPLGSDPTHCARCRAVHEARICAGSSAYRSTIERVEVTSFGQVGRLLTAWCGPCGKPMEDT